MVTSSNRPFLKPVQPSTQFFVDLVRDELDRESRELEEDAMHLFSPKKGHVAEDQRWLSTEDDAAWGEFDEKRFLGELRAKTGGGVEAMRLKRAAA